MFVLYFVQTDVETRWRGQSYEISIADVYFGHYHCLCLYQIHIFYAKAHDFGKDIVIASSNISNFVSLFF